MSDRGREQLYRIDRQESIAHTVQNPDKNVLGHHQKLRKPMVGIQRPDKEVQNMHAARKKQQSFDHIHPSVVQTREHGTHICNDLNHSCESNVKSDAPVRIYLGIRTDVVRKTDDNPDVRDNEDSDPDRVKLKKREVRMMTQTLGYLSLIHI